MINYKVSLDGVIPLLRKLVGPMYQIKGYAPPSFCEAKWLGEYDFKNRDHVHAVAKSY